VPTVSADPIASEARHFDRHRIQVSDRFELEVFDWSPASPARDPLVFVPGWLTLVESWGPVLRRMVRDRRVVYLETREKRSAKMPSGGRRSADFDLSRFGADLKEVCERLDLADGRSLLFGSSLGANAILECLAGGAQFRAAFLVSPNIDFEFPVWARFLMRFPPAVYRALLPFIVWNLKRFRLDAKKEPEQVARYERSLAAADLSRLRLAALALSGYSARKLLGEIKIPVAVAYAVSDRLHGAQKARQMAAELAAGTAIDCVSNRAMHEPEIVETVDRFVEGLQ